MRIALCDDNNLDLDLLYDYCIRYSSLHEIRKYSSASELLAAYDCFMPELIFLDIEMKAPTGYDAAMILSARSPKPLIIFVTQTLNYATRGYGIAFRYISKPLEYSEFRYLMNLAEQELLSQSIAVTSGNMVRKVNINAIYYFEAHQHNTIIHTEKELITTTEGFTSYIEQFRAYHFIRCHRSFCINPRYVDRYDAHSIRLLNLDIRIPIGRSYRDTFRDEMISGCSHVPSVPTEKPSCM